MITKLDFKNKIASSIETFASQKSNIDPENKGRNNIVVDGAGKGIVTTSADESVVLIADGEDFVFAEGELNQIEAQAGNNKIQVAGNANSVKVENGYNDISSIGAYNEIKTDKGNNQVVSVGSHNSISADNGDNRIFSFGNHNVINTQNGNNSIMSGGDNNNIAVKNGDNAITSGGYKRTDTGYKIEGKGNNNVIEAGDGNDKIYSTGDGNRILGGKGKDDIHSTGNSNFIDGGLGYDTIQSFGDENKLYAGDDKDGNTLLSIGKGNDITGSDGNDWILSIGDNNNIAAKEGNNNIVFNGNHINVSAGDGNNTVETLDFAIMNNKTFDYGKYGEYLEGQTSVEHYSEFDSSTKETKEIGRKYGQAVSSEIRDINADSIIKQLPAAEQKLAEGIDFSATTKDGKPKYVICRAQKDGKLHIYQNESGNTYRAIGPNVSTSGDYRLQLSDQETQVIGSLKQKTTQQVTVIYQDVITNKYNDYEKTTIEGNKDIHVTFGKGSNNILLNASEDVTIEGNTIQLDENGEYKNGNSGSQNNIFVTGSIVSTTKTSRKEHLYQNKKETTFEKTSEKTTGNITATSTNAKTYDPLVVDFNRNGIVSASSMTGVDINGDGIADGAAANGDKMLAMSDINGNGVIDGSEIFGNQTVSPFTGKVLEVSNGFEALKLIALEAEEYTGINCINDGNVNLAELQNALRSVGKNLGFISDENVTNLESLGHVASINVDDYSEIDDSGDAQFKQIGHYTDNEGNQYQAGDFWFKGKKAH